MSEEQPVLGLDMARCSGCTEEPSSASSPAPLPVMVEMLPVRIGQRACRTGRRQPLTLGARGSVLGWYITSPSQGHGQSTRQKPTWHILSPFKISPTSFSAVFLGQEMAGTFTVFQIM